MGKRKGNQRETEFLPLSGENIVRLLAEITDDAAYRKRLIGDLKFRQARNVQKRKGHRRGR